MKDSRIGHLLDLILDPASKPGERENARVICKRLLDAAGTTASDLLTGRPKHSAGIGTITRMTVENTRLKDQVAELQRQVAALVAKRGTPAVEVWLASGGLGPLPPAENGHYPFPVLKMVCNRQVEGKGWQAALSLALAKAGNGFRCGQIEDWQRSRKGVPAWVVAFAETATLMRPKAHRWTPEQRAEALYRIGQGESDTEIATALMAAHGAFLTAEAIRAIRKAARTGSPDTRPDTSHSRSPDRGPRSGTAARRPSRPAHSGP